MADTRKVIKQGVVVSDKNDKTVVVRVQRQFIHPLYKKTVRRHKKFMAHDENNDAHEGDTVQIVESRPMSARKRWALHKIVERSK
ncbi:MAG: 30S ribosomal protein S17 [Candidatus Cloacimonetes bacterium]|nr:30S ribosomal protein S17 [Candidatus Cloacimonadota bacterium]MDD4224498.1 30S ribosomal protein S17 [Candidatus Cloacimonadota bacterium]